MHGNEFLVGYSAKLVEYGLAVGYLLLFVGFWRYLQGGRPAAEAAAQAGAEPVHTGWFTVPENVALHPGHSWARLEADGSVAVGLDDLGHRLVGDLDRIDLPDRGDRVEQGAPAVTLSAGGRSVKVVSPVDGEVIWTSDNDKIVTRYMDDKEFGSAAFAVLSKAIYDSIPPADASGKQ